ncbi:hypothetical protein [Thiolapillus sp.]|uniref:hypothetical protein n=1 Tax=Thiolapillus sp. TaxID=2017437 RepID=UPI003AF9E4E4
MIEDTTYYIRLRHDKSITVAQHIENVSIALNTLINMPQCADDDGLTDNIQQLVVAYDRLVMKIAAQKNQKEEMKNEPL